ncbi:Ion channel [Salegentibacter echinorum]|uniref:Ion channel n=1 Tax=Salegentibacter echinorum TaxID=1073325 RepID=A0A1M5KD95_SALEC|nr:potassium channel family protein [Salegentibacter echinorum]SHG50717.1 Ion channel [Salegentibacter echinorum]
MNYLLFSSIPAPFNYIFFIIGIFILIGVVIDIFKTVIYINGGGRLSTFVADLIWKIFYRLAGRNGKSSILNIAGGIILLSLVFMWIFLIWLGYSLIYLADTNSVINNDTGEPADIIGNIYFVGYTLTSLGNGDFSPGTDGWKMVSNIMGLNTTIFISLGISYLLPVLQAVIDKRTLAIHINKMGTTPDEMIKNGYNGTNFEPLYRRFSNLETLLLKHGERHLAYPILHYFHSNNKKHSLSLSLAVLDEAMTIQEIYKIDESEKAYHWEVLRGALNNFYYRLDDKFIISAETPPPFDYKTKLPEEFSKDHIGKQDIDLEKFQNRRCKLLGYIHKNGWTWEDVVIPEEEIEEN